MMIVNVFLFLAFTTLALSMIFLSQVYLRLSGFRRNASLLEYSSENGIKDGVRYLLEAIGRAALPGSITEERYAELRASAQNSGIAVIEDALQVRFPVLIRDESGAMTWTSQTGCRLDRVIEAETCFSARFQLHIDSSGELKNFVPQKNSSFDGQADILAGNIPLPFIPFLISQETVNETGEEFAARNKISLAQTNNNLAPIQPVITENDLISQDALPLLQKTLQIKVFSPQDLSAAKLRSVLGLEASTEPVPEGVYLIRTDLGLGGVFVMGDVQEMGLAIENGWQVVSFRMDAGLWNLKFNPSEGKTLFSSPSGEEAFDYLPLGIVMVTGKILSLGGGVAGPDGGIRIIKDQEIPSLLQGVNLTLVASDKITITSHLLRQGIKWQDGIPYIKEEQAQLIIYSTGRDILQGSPVEGGIVIAENAPRDIKIQASLAARGTGFGILGEEKKIQILGGLQASGYESGGNELRLTALPPGTGWEMLALPAPLTADPVLSLSQFKALEWKEF
jgi:hypothetical protein